jgi:hypothetical protein
MKFKEDPYRVYLELKRLKKEEGLTNQQIASFHPKFGFTEASAKTLVGRILNIEYLREDIKKHMAADRLPQWKDLDKIIRSKKKALDVTEDQYKIIAHIENIKDIEVLKPTDAVSGKKEYAGASVLQFPNNLHNKNTENSINLHNINTDKIEITDKTVDPESLGAQGQQNMEEKESLASVDADECILNAQCTLETLGVHGQQSSKKVDKIADGGDYVEKRKNIVDMKSTESTESTNTGTKIVQVNRKKYRKIIFGKIDRWIINEIKYFSKASFMTKLMSILLVGLTIYSTRDQSWIMLTGYVVADIFFIYSWSLASDLHIKNLRWLLTIFVCLAAISQPAKDLFKDYQQMSETNKGYKTGNKIVTREHKHERLKVAQESVDSYKEQLKMLDLLTHPLQVAVENAKSEAREWVDKTRRAGIPNPVGWGRGSKYKPYKDSIGEAKSNLQNLNVSEKLALAQLDLSKAQNLSVSSYSTKEKSERFETFLDTLAKQGISLIMRLIAVYSIIALSIASKKTIEANEQNGLDMILARDS